MEKALYVKNLSWIGGFCEGNFLRKLEGEILFSELKEDTLTIKLASNNKPIWIRGRDIRIDIGEKIRVHYENNNSNAIVAVAYEILDKSGDDVLFRYVSSRKYKFVDRTSKK